MKNVYIEIDAHKESNVVAYAGRKDPELVQVFEHTQHAG